MDKILNILSNMRPDIDFEHTTGLLSEKILDSLDMFVIVGEIADTFNISFSPFDIVPENFDSVAQIYEFVLRRGGRV